MYRENEINNHHQPTRQSYYEKMYEYNNYKLFSFKKVKQYERVNGFFFFTKNRSKVETRFNLSKPG